MKEILGSIKKAIIELLILKLLSESDMYGYQITQEIKKRSNERLTILEGSMYPILYRLCESHCISSYEKKVGVRLTRVYYHLEADGANELEKMFSDFHDSIQLIEFLINSAEGDTYESTIS